MRFHPKDGLCTNPDCRVPLRRSQQRITDHPGTRVHAGNGLCYTCWRRDRKHATNTPANVAALNAYLNSRRNRATA